MADSWEMVKGYGDVGKDLVVGAFQNSGAMHIYQLGAYYSRYGISTQELSQVLKDAAFNAPLVASALRGAPAAIKQQVEISLVLFSDQANEALNGNFRTAGQVWASGVMTAMVIVDGAPEAAAVGKNVLSKASEILSEAGARAAGRGPESEWLRINEQKTAVSKKGKVSPAHVIEKHVTKSPVYLIKRLGREPNIPRATSFFTQDSAARIIKEIENNPTVQTQLAAFKMSNEPSQSVDMPLGRLTGYGWERGQWKPRVYRGALVAFRREVYQGTDYIIITAYPSPTPVLTMKPPTVPPP